MIHSVRLLVHVPRELFFYADSSTRSSPFVKIDPPTHSTSLTKSVHFRFHDSKDRPFHLNRTDDGGSQCTVRRQ